MKHKKSIIEKTLELMTIVTFFALISVVFLQIFSRFLLPKSPAWTEEVSRLLFIYSITFGAPLALKRDEYVRVDLLINFLPKKMQAKLDVLIYMLLTVFFGIILTKGYYFGALGFTQSSPALGFPMFIPYMTIAISSLFLTFYCLLKVKEKVSEMKSIEVTNNRLEKEKVGI